ncbi:hypothetical protein [Parvibaculum sp.]|uniref:hypothetical protein n=1 Tax=Parvibaculum sp. TaxID=2024848 RepID=UPI002BCB502E|nr:hypothetical protein [Parvibaculum sp.]HUD52437.1 hypothetical protein [Parvibaculum sp.]
MIVHIFRGPGRIFAFSQDESGSNLPAKYRPWFLFKSLEMIRGEAQPGVIVDECLDDIEAFGVHVTDAHIRITEQATT